MESGTIGTRLRSARKNARLSLEELGRLIGVSAQAVQQWEKGRTAPDPERLSQVANHLKVSVQWLITGHSLSELKENGYTTQVLHSGGRQVPRLSFAQVSKQDQSRVPTQYINTHFPCSELSYSLIVEDASCAPEYQPGDSIVIDPSVTPIPGDMVLVLVGEAQRPVFRRYKRLSSIPHRFSLEALNPLWDSFENLTNDSATILGVMSEHTRPRRSAVT